VIKRAVLRRPVRLPAWLAFVALFVLFKVRYIRPRLAGYSRERARRELALMLARMRRRALEALAEATERHHRLCRYRDLP
jgi:hypothetical protein